MRFNEIGLHVLISASVRGIISLNLPNYSMVPVRTPLVAYSSPSPRRFLKVIIQEIIPLIKDFFLEIGTKP